VGGFSLSQDSESFNREVFMRSVAVLAAMAVAGGMALAQAQSNSIKERQALMEENGKAMKLVGDMLKGERPYDAKAAGDAMQSLNGSVDKFLTLFPAGSETGFETRARPEIWKNKKDFEDWGNQMKQDTAKAQAAAAGGPASMRTAMADVGKTCSGCHDDYRTEKK
jgi:cytochrome c556